MSIAAGPVGRNAEAAGAASLKSVAGIFSYSKTKGLFAGVSLEGSAIIERRDANEKLYSSRLTAKQLLEGAVPPPPAAAPLMSILNSRVFAGMRPSDDADYNDIPVYDDRHDDVVWEGRRGNAYGEGVRRNSVKPPPSAADNESNFSSDRPKRATTWQDDTYDRPLNSTVTRSRTGSGFDDDYQYSDNGQMSSPRVGEKKVGPGRPTAAKPLFQGKTGGGPGGQLKKDEAVALFTFDGDQPGDLSFKKGDVIQVTKKTESNNDWWYVLNLLFSCGRGTEEC